MSEFILTEVQYGHVLQTRFYMKDGLITAETRGYALSTDGIVIDGFDGLYIQSSIGNAKTDDSVKYLTSDELKSEQAKQDEKQADREKEKQAYIAKQAEERMAIKKSSYDELIKLGVIQMTASALSGYYPSLAQVKK
jgi:hypothetical protein